MSVSSRASIGKAFTETTKLRAKAYVYLYEELVKRVGQSEAKDICSKILYRLGADIANSTLRGLKTSKLELRKLGDFLVKAPEHALANKKRALVSKSDLVQIEFNDCPLVQTWREQGLDEEKILLLCDVSRNIDRGIAESFGFVVNHPYVIAEGKKKCLMEIRASKKDEP